MAFRGRSNTCNSQSGYGEWDDLGCVRAGQGYLTVYLTSCDLFQLHRIVLSADFQDLHLFVVVRPSFFVLPVSLSRPLALLCSSPSSYCGLRVRNTPTPASLIFPGEGGTPWGDPVHMFSSPPTAHCVPLSTSFS